MRAVLLSAALIVALPSAPQAQSVPADLIPAQSTADPGPTESLDTLVANAAHEPAIVLLEMSIRLFGNGRQDDGVFWYYVGQLRSRMEAGTDSDANEAYSAIFATAGPAINGYAFGDVDKLATTFDRVLAWDEAHPLPGIDPAVRAKQRAGLAGLRAYVLAHRDEIRKSRAANGLPNAPG